MVYIKDIMSKDVLALPKSISILETAKLMTKRKVSCVVVISKDNIPIGIVTERDITRKLVAKSKIYTKTTLNDLMTKPIKTISDEVDFFKASLIMKKNKIRRLPVVHNKKLIGIITQTDLLYSATKFIKKISKELSETVNKF